MAGDRLFEVRLQHARRDLDRLYHGYRGLRSRARRMRANTESGLVAPDHLQSDLHGAITEATAHGKDLRRLMDEAQWLVNHAPRPDRSLRVGHKPTAATGVPSELGGKVRRLQREAGALDRELRALHASVRRRANDPLRHTAGHDPAGALMDLIEVVNGALSMMERLLRRLRR